MRNKQWIKTALLTATLVSLAAPSLAQRGGNDDGNGNWRNRGGGEARGGGDRGGGSRGGDGDGGDRGGGSRQQQSAPAPQAAPAPPVMDNPRAPRPFTERPVLGDRNPPPPVAQPAPAPNFRDGNGGGRPGGPGNVIPNNAGRPDRDNRPDGRRPDNRPDDNGWRNRDNDGRNNGWRDNDRRDNDRDRDRDWRDRNDRNDGRDRDRGWNDRNRDRDWRPPNQGRPPIINRHRDYPSWTNDWRRDNRYNWQGWRNSNRDIFRLRPYYAPFGWNRGYFRFSLGAYIDEALFGPSYWIDEPYRYHLPSAYGTLRWVRYYDDALLIDIRDGYVVDIIYDVFW